MAAIYGYEMRMQYIFTCPPASAKAPLLKGLLKSTMTIEQSPNHLAREDLMAKLSTVKIQTRVALTGRISLCPMFLQVSPFLLHHPLQLP